jgi:hypothetical protein
MRYFSILLALALLITVARAQLSQTGMGSVAGGGGPPPVDPCGAIDLSTGCPQPMLGVM